MSRNFTEIEVDQSSGTLDLHSPFHDPGHPTSMLSTPTTTTRTTRTTTTTSSSSLSLSSTSSLTNIADSQLHHHVHDVKSLNLDTYSDRSESIKPPVTSASSLSIPSLSITSSRVHLAAPAPAPAPAISSIAVFLL